MVIEERTLWQFIVEFLRFFVEGNNKKRGESTEFRLDRFFRKEKSWHGSVSYTRARSSSPLFCVCCRHCTMERKLNYRDNRGILGHIWIASIIPVIRKWFRLNLLQLFTIVLIVRIELEAVQPIVIVPIARVVSVVFVVFSYDRLDRLVLF